MDSLSCPRILISGIKSQVGKSLFGLGLAYELRRRNLGVSSAMIGSALAQATVLKRISGRCVHSLDSKILSKQQALTSVALAGIGSDLLLIQGSGVLYDGAAGGSWTGLDAEIAELTKCPVVMVVDGRNFAEVQAKELKQYFSSAPALNFAGVVLNRLTGSEDIDLIKRIFEAYALPTFLGFMPELHQTIELPPSAVSQLENKTLVPMRLLLELGAVIAKTVDVERIITEAQAAPSIEVLEKALSAHPRRTRIAVSDDSCFSLGYQNNLDYLRHYGAELVPFSPLADEDLPRKIGAVYLTGGYLSEYAAELSNNLSLKKALRDFADAGGVIYSEGAGSAYLCQEFQLANREKYEGVGLITGSAVASKSDTTYFEGSIIEESILGRSGMIFRGLETGEWRLTKDERLIKVLRVSRKDRPSHFEGFSPGAQILITFTFPHFGSNPLMAKNLVDAAEVVQKI